MLNTGDISIGDDSFHALSFQGVIHRATLWQGVHWIAVDDDLSSAADRPAAAEISADAYSTSALESVLALAEGESSVSVKNNHDRFDQVS